MTACCHCGCLLSCQAAAATAAGVLEGLVLSMTGSLRKSNSNAICRVYPSNDEGEMTECKCAQQL
jgi:hypothetical protein